MDADTVNLLLAFLCCVVALLAAVRSSRFAWIELFPGQRRLPALLGMVVGIGIAGGYAELIRAIFSDTIHPEGISEAIVVLVLVGGIALCARMLYVARWLRRLERLHVRHPSAASVWLSVSFLTLVLFMWLLVAAQNSDHPLPWYLLAGGAALTALCSGIIASVLFVDHRRVDSSQTR